MEGAARAVSPARRRSRTPLRAEEEGPPGGGERRRRVDGASRRTPPTRTEHGRAGAGAETREKEAQEEYEYYSEDEEEEEETCPDREEEDDRWESGRRPPPEPPLPPRGDWDWSTCDVRECGRPARGGDSVCCDPCVRTHGRDHTYNCNMRARSAAPSGGPEGKGGGRGKPGGQGGPGGDRPGKGNRRKKPGKALRDRERNMYRQGAGKGGKSRGFQTSAYQRALGLGKAAATVRSQTSRLKTWDKALRELERQGLVTVPDDIRQLSPETARAGVACLRARGYRSAELYLSSAMTRHRSLYAVTHPLQSAQQEAIRISRRGVGPGTRQTAHSDALAACPPVRR